MKVSLAGLRIVACLVAVRVLIFQGATPPAKADQARARALFEQRVSEAQAKGVEDDNLPFYFFAGQGRPGVLLIHGLTATPWETRGLGNYLYEKNMTVYGLLLPGHGTRPEDLAGTEKEAWVAATEQALALLRQVSPRVYVVGISLGGLLALYLAQRNAVEGVAVVAPALKIRSRLTAFIPIIKYVKGYSRRELEPEERGHYYEERPLAAIWELVKLASEVRKGARQLQVPMLVLQSKQDGVVDPRATEKFYAQAQSQDKELVFLEGSRHVLIQGEKKERALELVFAFIQRQEARHYVGKKLSRSGAPGIY